MENPATQPNQPIMDVRPSPGYQIRDIPMRQPDQQGAAFQQASPPPSPVSANTAKTDTELDHILKEVNRQVAKAEAPFKKVKRISFWPKIYLREIVAVVVAAGLIALAVRVYK